jgi:hypothetical protein
MTEHARGSVKGIKSYDKVCNHLIATQDFKDYVARISEKLNQANVSGWEFVPGGSDYDDNPLKKKNVVPPCHKLLVDWGDKVEHAWQIPDEWTISLSTLCDDDELDGIVKRNFNTKACPTYFCKKETLIGRDKDGGRSSKLDNKWANYVRRYLSDLLMDKISKTQEKIRQAMRDAVASDAFAEDKVAFHERCIIDEIKLVLLKFSSVAKPHVLKAALDEYIIHDVMDS